MTANCYEVFFGNEQVGKVQAIREGLYYRFVCRCQLSGEAIFRLRICTDTSEESLGVLAPEGDGFGLVTRIPAKRIGTGEMHFSIVPHNEKAESHFVPIYPEEPFAYIERLKEAFFEEQNGVDGVVLPGRTEAPDENDNKIAAE